MQPADAAGGVAAGVDLAAIAIVDAHEGVGAAPGALDGDHLIEADGVRRAKRLDRLGREAHGSGAAVENDEFVSKAVHLAEWDRAARHGSWSGANEINGFPPLYGGTAGKIPDGGRGRSSHRRGPVTRCA